MGISGISPYIGRFWLFGDLAFAAFAPILGFMIILNFTCHTELEANLYFSSFFIFLFTLSAGAILGIVRFFSDRYLNTTFLSSNYHLMNEILVLILFGILGMLIYIFYLNINSLINKDESIIEEAKSEFILSIKYFKSHFLKFLNLYFWNEKKRSLLISSKIFQIGILFFVFFNLVIENFWGFPVALISFILSVFTPIYSRFLNVKISPSFQFWISATLFLYSAGESLRFQQIFGWWNPFTHFIGGIIVGTLVIIYLFYLDDVFDNLNIPIIMIPILVLTFILSISVLWEVFEFLVDSFFGTSLQPSLQNTVYDMIANTIGAFFALLIASLRTPFETFTKVLYHKEGKNFADISLPSLEEKNSGDTLLPSPKTLFSTVGVLGILFSIIGILIFLISLRPHIPSRMDLLFSLISILSISILFVIFILSISDLWETFECILDNIIEKKRT
ncbi:MAG: hypothetical protein KGY68_07325 [Candidatus Thermoplasmatota archaeon]|nr:hypothetical protein [Candidatus Thermoplasmatota archaeon]